MSTTQSVIWLVFFLGYRLSTCFHIFITSHQFEQYSLFNIEERRRLDKCCACCEFFQKLLVYCASRHAFQSSHFGASNNQISLHTSILYMKGKPTSFCSLSESTMHESAAIWVHQLSVLKYVQELYLSVQYTKFWSDGPTIQCCNNTILF